MLDFSPNLPQGSAIPISFKGLTALSGISSQILWGAFALLVVLVILVSIVLFYHWFKYGFADAGVILAEVLYTVVTIVTLIVMIGSISYYVSS